MLPNTPFLSVLTICKNHEAALFETFKSVQEQQLEPALLEHVIICSIQSPPPDYLSFARGVENVKLVLEMDAGISDGFNKGLRLCSGSYILILNSGDCFASNRSAEHVINKAQEFGYPHIMSFAVDIGEGARKVMHGKELIDAPHQGLVVSSIAYKRLGGYSTSFAIRMDLEFLLRFRRMGLDCRSDSLVISKYPQGGLSNMVENRPRFYYEGVVAHLLWNPKGAVRPLIKYLYWRMRALLRM